MEIYGTIGHATYVNKVSGEIYELGFQFSETHDTELSKAWELVKMVARMKAWNVCDIRVNAGK